MAHDAGDREVAGLLKEFTEAFSGLDTRLVELASLLRTQNSNTQVVKIDAGGWGVVVSLIMVAFLAGLNIAQASNQAANQASQAAEISDIRRRNDLANDKLSVILQWAPELAKKVDDSTNKKGGNAP